MTQIDVDPREIPFGPGGGTAWLITRHRDARPALSDPRLSKALSHRTSLAAQGGVAADTVAAMASHMLNADPPDHTRLRRLVSAAFTARRMEGLRPRIRAISAELLDGLAVRNEFDLIDEYAFPLPFTVICELIGVPQVDRDSFRSWTNVLVSGLGGATPEHDHAVTSIVGYTRDLLRRLRAEPDDALMSGLLQASDAGDRLSEDELTSMVFLLLLAGHETTVNLIGNAMYLLLGRPEQADALRAHPTLIPAAIDEILRYESPVKNSSPRVAVEPVTIGGVTIPAGSLVLISLLSANRDPEAFAEAETFDMARTDAYRHLAFGHGPHFCLGAPLARIEGEIAVGSLLTRFPRLRSAVPLADVQWRPGMLIHGVRRLPVRIA